MFNAGATGGGWTAKYFLQDQAENRIEIAQGELPPADSCGAS